MIVYIGYKLTCNNGIILVERDCKLFSHRGLVLEEIVSCNIMCVACVFVGQLFAEHYGCGDDAGGRKWERR